MNERLVVALNGVSQLEYDRDKALPERQRHYLDKMDDDMSAGITIDDRRIDRPNTMERAQFVAMNLIDAVRVGDETMAAAMCSYLANRLPELKQVKATEFEDRVSIDLVFDKAFVAAEPIRFVDKPARDHDSD